MRKLIPADKYTIWGSSLYSGPDKSVLLVTAVTGKNIYQKKKYHYCLGGKNIVCQDSCNRPGLALVPGDPHLCGELHTGDQGHHLYLPEAQVAGF